MKIQFSLYTKVLLLLLAIIALLLLTACSEPPAPSPLPTPAIKSETIARRLLDVRRVTITSVPRGLPQYIESKPARHDEPPAAIAGLPTERIRQLNRIAEFAPPATSVDDLARSLTVGLEHDLDKAYVLFRWITTKIAYDTEGYFSSDEVWKRRDYSPEAVLERKTAICGGYARLFEALATASGLEAKYVSGYAKGYGYQPSAELPRHAWNVVRINNNWKLIEATWGAGGIRRSDERFVFRFKPEYFLSDPASFVKTHFPKDPRWQLLTPPISLEHFKAIPPR